MDRPKTNNRAHKKRGRPQFTPTDDNRLSVRTMIGFGMPQDRIRQAIINPATGRPISMSTLAIAFKDEIEAGGAEMDELVAKSHRKQIESGNTVATIWYQKNRWGWKDRSDHVVGHLFGGSERNPDNNEVSLGLKFVDGDGVERTTIDLDAFASRMQQSGSPMKDVTPVRQIEHRRSVDGMSRAELEAQIARERVQAKAPADRPVKLSSADTGQGDSRWSKVTPAEYAKAVAEGRIIDMSDEENWPQELPPKSYPEW
jgi:hypothetical protein